MGAKPELTLFSGGKEREEIQPQAIHGPKGVNDVKQSGCRLAVRVTKESSLSGDDIKKWHVAWTIAGRHSAFANLNKQQQAIAYNFIERFIAEGNIPDEDAIINFIDTICVHASKINLPQEPHQGDNSKINFSVDNEQAYYEYLRSLSIASKILGTILTTHLAALKTVNY